MPRLVSVGNVIVDIVMRIDAIPDPGGDVIASASEITAGGGLNTMVAARRDGLDVVFAGQYGTGPFGDVVRAALAESGVEVVQPGLADLDSGYCVALVDATTERTFVTSVGAEGQLNREDLDRVALRPDDTVFVSGYGLAHPMNGAAIADWLGTLPAGVRVMFDPSPLVDTLPAEVLDAVLRRADIVSANGREARLMVAGAGAGAGVGAVDLGAAAESIAARSGGVVIVRDGAVGCWVAGAVGVDAARVAGAARAGAAAAAGAGAAAGSPAAAAILVPGFAVTARDTNGAGDAHDGVLAAALARGDDLLAAARRANAAAAIAVTRLGPATAPTAVEIDDFLRSVPASPA